MTYKNRKLAKQKAGQKRSRKERKHQKDKIKVTEKRMGLGSSKSHHSTREFVERYSLSNNNSTITSVIWNIRLFSIRELKERIPYPFRIFNCARPLIYALVAALQDRGRGMGKVLMMAENFFHQDAEFNKDELLETIGMELFCFGVLYKHFKELDADEDEEVYELDLDADDLPEGFKQLVQRLRTALDAL
ncbi:hypothetical protein HD553DRAFT_302096 [Filobasidium floriforme]|uniref:uncharacterized protein n=1 Tax=Filobasidium floriforme TaxID=5210 RepID=UPI001E8D23C4|nr:uncharacterized protein HD553DRAFT_302096 [Filobasidium floriforme]KAH8090307.1 hypothetical protein HD553DRAFT_302096 [Filobasidium floriforme]